MKINVPEKYADLYLKALTEKKQLLEAKIEEFKKEIQEIDNHISALTSMPIFKDGNNYPMINWNANAYQVEWSWARKISYYEDFKGSLMTSAEIVDFIVDRESDQDKQKVRSSISAALSNRTRSGLYQKFVDPVSNTSYYGPSDWFNENDEPLPDFVPGELKNRLLGRS